MSSYITERLYAKPNEVGEYICLYYPSTITGIIMRMQTYESFFLIVPVTKMKVEVSPLQMYHFHILYVVGQSVTTFLTWSW